MRTRRYRCKPRHLVRRAARARRQGWDGPHPGESLLAFYLRRPDAFVVRFAAAPHPWQRRFHAIDESGSVEHCDGGVTVIRHRAVGGMETVVHMPTSYWSELNDRED